MMPILCSGLLNAIEARELSSCLRQRSNEVKSEIDPASRLNLFSSLRSNDAFNTLSMDTFKRKVGWQVSGLSHYKHLPPHKCSVLSPNQCWHRLMKIYFDPIMAIVTLLNSPWCLFGGECTSFVIIRDDIWLRMFEFADWGILRQLCHTVSTITDAYWTWREPWFTDIWHCRPTTLDLLRLKSCRCGMSLSFKLYSLACDLKIAKAWSTMCRFFCMVRLIYSTAQNLEIRTVRLKTKEEGRTKAD